MKRVSIFSTDGFGRDYKLPVRLFFENSFFSFFVSIFYLFSHRNTFFEEYNARSLSFSLFPFSFFFFKGDFTKVSPIIRFLCRCISFHFIAMWQWYGWHWMIRTLFFSLVRTFVHCFYLFFIFSFFDELHLFCIFFLLHRFNFEYSCEIILRNLFVLRGNISLSFFSFHLFFWVEFNFFRKEHS